ncbi:hypothetical protein Csa_014822 [Cucumis sativus]|nr:hypothetical protein Csa_014822 [Cucumis sativus]
MKDTTETMCKRYHESSPLGLIAMVREECIETHGNVDIIKQIRETTSNLNFDEVMIGREVEVSNIVKLVIEFSKEHQISIIPIVGMRGLGNTTLAFNHEPVKGHFDETIWLCVWLNMKTPRNLVT